MRCAKMLGDIVSRSHGLGHCLHLQASCEAQCRLDVSALSPLVPASQQNDDHAPLLLEIHPVAGSIVDSKSRDAFARRPHVYRVSSCQTLDPDKDARSRLRVAQAVQPSGVYIRLADLEYENLEREPIVAKWLQ